MSKATASFNGFLKEAFAFLENLSLNNNKTWFDAHRATHDTAIVVPALRFIEAMGAAIQTFAPSVAPEPRVGGSLFRIHRDTRFSADKSPYKTHVGIRFRDGDTARSSKCTGPLFYVEFDAKNLRLGVGIKEFDSRTLEAYRDAVARTGDATEIRTIIHHAAVNGRELVGDELRRVPPVYSDQPDHELLKRKGLFIREERPLPAQIQRPEFVTYCRCWFEAHAPLFGVLRKIALKGLASSAKS